MKDLEHKQQKALMAWLRMQHPGAYDMCFAIPNGGQRNIKVAAKLKAEGVKAGVPDLMIAIPAGGYHGLFIEYKTEKGTLQKTQKEWLAKLIDQGYKAICCKGMGQAMDEINLYLTGVSGSNQSGRVKT